MNISEVIVHPEYVLPSEVTGTNKAQWNNDYGLLRVSEPITMNDYIRPVCIPQTAHDIALVRNILKLLQERECWHLTAYCF